MRLIDADAYEAEMRSRQDACEEWYKNAKDAGDERKMDMSASAFTAFSEAKMTLDNMPTIDAAPRWHRVEEPPKEGNNA